MMFYLRYLWARIKGNKAAHIAIPSSKMFSKGDTIIAGDSTYLVLNSEDDLTLKVIKL